LWATRRVGWLIEQIRSNGENKEVRDEITSLGTRYGIVTPYTSYLATDGSERRNEADRSGFRNNQPRPRNGNISPSALPGLMSASGQSAVEASKKARQQQNSVNISADAEQSIADDSGAVISKIGAKTFYLENNVWVDSEYKTDSKISEITLKFAEADYFELIGKEPELGKFFALGEQVVVVWKNKVYRVIK
jgi:Ca-activated chloride channel family protein